MAIDGGGGFFDLVAVEDFAQAVEIGVPLGQDLIDAAAFADLVFDFAAFLVPVGGQGVAALDEGDFVDEGFDDGFVFEVDALVVVVAVEEVGVGPGFAAGEDGAKFGGGIDVTKGGGHDGSCFERAQVETGEPGIGAEEFHVEGVVLPSPEDAGFVGIPAVGVAFAPGEFDGLFDGGPDGA